MPFPTESGQVNSWNSFGRQVFRPKDAETTCKCKEPLRWSFFHVPYRRQMILYAYIMEQRAELVNRSRKFRADVSQDLCHYDGSRRNRLLPSIETCEFYYDIKGPDRFGNRELNCRRRGQ
jgi:hypothetical protein